MGAAELRGPLSVRALFAAGPASSIELRVGHGVVGDRHAGPLGPRQVLVAAGEVADELLGGDDAALQANVVTSGLDVDALASGCVLAVGEEVLLRITHACEVCGKASSWLEVRRALEGRRGQLCVVLRGGLVDVGEPVRVVEGARFPTVPEDAAGRVSWVVARLPADEILTYGVLRELVGAPRGFLRAFPRYLRDAGVPDGRVLTAAEAAAHGREPWRPVDLYVRPENDESPS